MKLSRKNIVLYLLIGGFLFYTVSAILSAIFITPIPMDSDWCKDGEVVQIGENDSEFICFEFKNEWQKSIYYYNQKMIGRNKNLFWLRLFSILIITVFIFYVIPKWKRNLNVEKSKAIGSSIALSIGIVLLMPFFFSLILPPPNEWLPKIFEEINDAQINEAIRKLNNNL